MLSPDPRNLFTTKWFYIFLSLVLTAITPNISEMAKNGITVERMLLLLSTITGTSAVFIEKMEKEKNLYTDPRLFGRNKDEAIAHVEKEQKQADLIASTRSITKDVIQDAIANPVEAIQNRAQDILNTSGDLNPKTPDPIKEIIKETIALP